MISMPIGRRRRRRRYAVGYINKDLRHMTHGVMVICLGFFLFFVGVLLTLLGVRNTNQESAKNAKQPSSSSTGQSEPRTDPLLVIGPILLICGFFVALLGGMFYGKYYRQFHATKHPPPTHVANGVNLHIDDFHGESYRQKWGPEFNGVNTVTSGLHNTNTMTSGVHTISSGIYTIDDTRTNI